MFDSQTIQMNGTTTVKLLSPWFPRGGDYAMFTMEVTAGAGTYQLLVTARHKNASETGDGTAVGPTTLFLTAPGRKTVDFTSGFKEMVRYEFELSGGTANVTTWATFRMLAAAWYDKV